MFVGWRNRFLLLDAIEYFNKYPNYFVQCDIFDYVFRFRFAYQFALSKTQLDKRSPSFKTGIEPAYNYVYRYVCLLITNDIVFCAFAKHTKNEHKCLYRIVYYPSGNTLACCLYIAGYNWQ